MKCATRAGSLFLELVILPADPAFGRPVLHVLSEGWGISAQRGTIGEVE